MCKIRTKEPWVEMQPTALLVLADGTVIQGKGLGATGAVEAEVCFNTALTGYEEILTDPSYTGQIVTFTFPHIGNTGINREDIEMLNSAYNFGAVGMICKAEITDPSNYRATEGLDSWLKARGIIGLAGIDTRALTALIREKSVPNAVITHEPSGHFNIECLKKRAAAWPGLAGLDLAKYVSSRKSMVWNETPWIWNVGYGEQRNTQYHIVTIDYGVKRNILRLFVALGAKVTVVPAHASAEHILAMNPDGIFLSNGPGDPSATGTYAVPVIAELFKSGLPLFGICLGHQMLALASGASTKKMHHGHHGSNHPVKDIMTGKVEVASMNHGFTVDTKTLPRGIEETHVSLFDGSNCGIRMVGKPVFSVQHHPEASPGPQDSHHLCRRFLDMIHASKKVA
ncbi:MAG: carbamoyl-phosphate synthase small subunit [Candidatus Tokpelaia sp. JSC085]|nr:MAG: carbamoyl-phosphate synthase small subunit [Candidatus Tokpelaia sp. JSC085]